MECHISNPQVTAWGFFVAFIITMANFNTHFNVALIASSVLATIGLMVGVYGFFDTLILVVAGTIGGLLPDIDLPSSKVSRIGFNITSGIGAGLGIILSTKYYATTPSHSLLVGAVVFLLIRYGAFGLFERVTVHRGMVHSVPYMAVLALLLVNLLYSGLAVSPELSWFVGLFVFFGAMVHLILDEMYSVDVLELKVKKSFGTALKFFDTNNTVGYALLYGILAVLWYISPTSVLLKALLPVLQYL